MIVTVIINHDSYGVMVMVETMMRNEDGSGCGLGIGAGAGVLLFSGGPG